MGVCVCVCANLRSSKTPSKTHQNKNTIRHDTGNTFDFMDLSGDYITTRGNKYKLIQHHCNYALRTFNFTNRVIPIWNSLSDYVASSKTVNTIRYKMLF